MNDGDLIKDVVATLGKDAVWAKLHSEPSLGFLLRVFKSAGDILPTCGRLKWETIGDVKKACQQFNAICQDYQILLDAIEPKPELRLEDCEKVSWVEMDAELRKQKRLHPTWHQFWNRDSFFYAPSYDDLLKLADKAKGYVSRFGIVNGGPEENDCDDAVMIVLGWLAMNGLGGTANGSQDTVHYRFAAPDPYGGHRSILTFTKEKKYHQWEPMGNANGTIITEANYPRLNGFSDAFRQDMVVALY